MADEFLTKSEHDEFAKRMEETNARQNKRLEILEESVKDINRLATSIEKIALTRMTHPKWCIVQLTYNKAELIVEDSIMTFVHNYNNIGENVLGEGIGMYANLGFINHKYGEIIAEAYAVKNSNKYAKELIDIIEGI